MVSEEMLLRRNIDSDGMHRKSDDLSQLPNSENELTPIKAESMIACEVPLSTSAECLPQAKETEREKKKEKEKEKSPPLLSSQQLAGHCFQYARAHLLSRLPTNRNHSLHVAYRVSLEASPSKELEVND